MNSIVRGAKFVDENNEKNDKIKKHVFTYFISFEALRKSIQNLEKCEAVLIKYYNGEITDKDTAIINSGKYNDSIMAKSSFLRVVVDSNYVENFRLDRADERIRDRSIVTIYKTGVSNVDLLSKFGIDMIKAKMIDETTLNSGNFNNCGWTNV